MNFSKTLNLLPREFKDKHLNRYLLYIFGGVFSFLLLVYALFSINIYYNEFMISHYNKKDAQYIKLADDRNRVKAEAAANRKLANENAADRFPFYIFMKFLETKKPSELVILSVDSDDRTPSKDDVLELVRPQPPSEPSASSAPDKAQANPSPSPQNKSLEYTSDISGRMVNLRGYSPNPHAISEFIYSLSRLDFVKKMNIIAIEEHKTTDNANVDIFEVEIEIK